ncbi:MAG: hypothetical protein RIT40_1594 [Planctomycetota bacterium]
MMRLVFSALLLAVAAPISQAQDLFWTPRRVESIKNIAGAAVSPDGSRVAYLVAVPRNPGVDDDGSPWTELHVLSTADGAARAYVSGKVNVGKPGFTPDGKGLAFLAKREGDKQTSLYVLPLDGGEAQKKIELATSISEYSFSADGGRVALLAQEEPSAARKKREDKGFKQQVYEEDLPYNRVHVAKLGDSAKPQVLGVEGHVHQLEWSPTDERILVSVAPTPLVDDEYVRHRVRVVDAADGRTLAAFENPGKLGDVGWSADAKHVWLVAGEDIHDPSAGRLWVAPSEGGAFVDVLGQGALADSAVATWTTNGLLHVVTDGCRTLLRRSTLAAGKVDSMQELIPAGVAAWTSLAASENGQTIALVGSTGTHAQELYVWQAGGKGAVRMTDSNPWLATAELARQEVVTWKARDGQELQGILIAPLRQKKMANAHPLVLSVHGGPEAHEMDGWLTNYSRPGQMLAEMGIAVFYPNYRGSTGRGVAFSKLGQGDAAGKEFDDLVDAVDHFIGDAGGRLVDPKKVGITGGSYGGYATAWCSTKHSERFAAGVMFVGIGDKLSKTGTTDIPNEEFYVHSLKRPWEAVDFFIERSPITYAGQSKTPLLILHGKEDPRVDPGQSRSMYRYLKLRGQAPVRLVLYPGEGHGNRKACARLDYALRMVQWFEHYLIGAGGEMPAWELDYGIEAK